MKQILFIILSFLPSILVSQITDDFSDGNFTSDPTWNGDNAAFEVSTAGQLHLKTTGADTTYLSVQCGLSPEHEWNFWLKLSFNTSANNFARFYLASDNPDLEGNLNGYYLQAGGSSDSVELYRQNNGRHTRILKLISAYTGNSVNTIRFRVIRDDTGKWTVYADISGNTSYHEEGSVVDQSITSAGWLGIFCRFTSSNASKFYFDDIYSGPVKTDTIPPGILSVEIAEENMISVKFSEAIDKTEAENPSNYLIPGYGPPENARLDSLDAGLVRISFATGFPSASCDTLIVKSVRDLSGNVSENLRKVFCFYQAEMFDIVISEIMADPTPQTGLPDAEYAELYNRCSFPVSLKGWTFSAGTTVKSFPEISMDPGEYLILAKEPMLSFYGRTITLFSSASTLPNDGTILTLRNEKNQVIHAINYSSEWYKNVQKKDGGWSLEMVDPLNPCGCSDNWQASEHILGGTPGSVNSVNQPHPDTMPPRLARVSVENDSLLRVFFSESIDSTSFPSAGQWRTDREESSVIQILMVPPLYSGIYLMLSHPLNPGIIYRLFMPEGIRDCSGNYSESHVSARFARPDSVSVSDIVINEILPDPYPDGERFIELYNRSEKALDIRMLVLLEPKTGLSGEADPVIITEEGRLIFPDEYVVLTKEPSDIASRYQVHDPDCFIKISSIPGMTRNDSGSVVLARMNDLEIIDRISYSIEMNFALLSSPEGVSLERINPDSPSESRNNWHSAAASSGYATPGYFNSHSTTHLESPGFVSLAPEVFSPDNDGRDDIVFITIRPDRPGYLANISVFSSSGSFVRQLTKNEMAASVSTVSWDGTTEDKRKAPAGIYIILAELFHPEGETRRYKLPVVLAGTF